MDLRARLRAVFELEDHPLEFIHEAPQGPGLSRLAFRRGQGEAVRGFLARPMGKGPFPAILYLHAHGGRYEIGADELMNGRVALVSPLGPVLAEMGIMALCLDLPCFGERRGQGESAAAKAALWRGRSLAGRMLGESKSALDWLLARPDVDSRRVGAFGLSMGATLGQWLAAADERLALAAHLCCFADYEAMIECGGHDLHGIYLTIPGLLNIAPNGEIAGLIAPRPQFIGVGAQDPLTPPRALEIALAQTRAAYGRSSGDLRVHYESESGHVETPAMRAALLAFLRAALLAQDACAKPALKEID